MNGDPSCNVSLQVTPAPAAYRDAQAILWGEAGVWAHDTFTALNASYFNNRIPYAGIVWGLTPHGGRLGHTSRVNQRITLHPALLDPHSDAWGVQRAWFGERYARDVLLHEMVHAFLMALGEKPDHNADPWCREVERLAPQLGLGLVKAKPVTARRIGPRVVKQPLEGHLPRGVFARFPHPLRPDGYYQGSNGKLGVQI